MANHKTKVLPVLLARKTFVFCLLMLAAAGLLTGCVSMSDPEESQEYRSDVVATVQAGQVVGQTFVSRRARLNGIQLWLRAGPEPAAPGATLTVQLYHAPGDLSPLVTIPLPVSTIPEGSPLKIALPPQADLPGQGYFITLTTHEAALQVLGRSEDAYPRGQLYAGGAPQDADLSFRLTYDYDPAAMLGDLGRALASAWLLLPLALTLWLPGRVLLGLTGLASRLDGGERAAVSIGLSLGLIPLALTWTSLVRLPWSRAGVWVGMALLLAALAIQVRHGRAASGRVAPAAPEKSRAKAALSWLWQRRAGLALAAIFVLTLAVRLAMTRDLAGPAWVDSVHHAMITRLIMEQGAFPPSYAPFLDIETASYHPGFHSAAAVFTWLSGLDLPAALLLLGQALNALVVFSVYLFTTSLTRNRAAAVCAALIAGLFTPMPAYYTSWGRYTQLASLLLLPAALAWIVWMLEGRVRRSWRPLLLAAVASGGLFLTHYRVIAFLGLLLIAYLGVYVLGGALRRLVAATLGPDREPQEPQPKPVDRRVAWEGLRFGLSQLLEAVRRWARDTGPWWAASRGVLAAAGWVALTAGLAIALTLPWWPATLTTLFIPRFGYEITTPAFSDFSWSYLTAALGKLSLGLAGGGLLVGLLRRRAFALHLPLWAGLMFLAANLAAWGLPGGTFINNTSVEILLFMPLAALGGYLSGEALRAGLKYLPRRGGWAYAAVFLAAGAALAVAGARQILPILNPATLLLREADSPAIAWIEQNVPAGETVLINPFAWGYNIYAGSDGGAWIIPLAGRKTLPPPVLYGLSASGDKINRINEIIRQALDLSQKPAELHAYLLSQGIHYIFIGARGGAFSPRLLSASPLFETRYAQEGAWVFQLIGP